MTRYYGWAGAILNVDLTVGKAEKEPLSPDFARKYLGGSGFNSAKLFELVKPETDALSPNNVLMFGIGTLSGTLAPGSARLTVTAKSPLTDVFGDANMGGFWSTEVKFAGYDQLAFFGKADHPVYLWIDNDKVEIRDASHLWGMSTWDVARAIKEEIGDPFIEVVCIGPAGENLVRIANVMCPTKRAAGRSGMGAVMGSKNLKAIAVRGTTDIAIARPNEFLQACKQTIEMIIDSSPWYQMYRDYGTPGIIHTTAEIGMTAVRNWQKNVFPNWEAISGRALKRDFYRSMRACAACHIACGPFHTIKSGEFAGVYGEGPEYGLTQMGLICECDNLAAILKMNELYNQYGMDCISADSILAWAMECYEKGILTKEDYGDDRPLQFGDYKSVIEIIPKIARREGFGNILAEGEKRAPKLVGRGSEKYMIHVKGQAPVVEDPRANKGFGLFYMTGTRGADHLKANILYALYILRDTDIGKEISTGDLGGMKGIGRPEGVGKKVMWGENTTQILDSLGICTRTTGSLDLLTKMVSSATGVDFTDKELLTIGERIFNIQKAFNARQGLTRKDDNYSTPHFEKDPVLDGPFKGNVLERDVLLDEYYTLRDWDMKTGLQTREKLAELGLEHVADELAKVNAVK